MLGMCWQLKSGKFFSERGMAMPLLLFVVRVLFNKELRLYVLGRIRWWFASMVVMSSVSGK